MNSADIGPNECRNNWNVRRLLGVGWVCALASVVILLCAYVDRMTFAAVLIRITTRIQEYLYHWKMVENGTYIII